MVIYGISKYVDITVYKNLFCKQVSSSYLLPFMTILMKI